MGYRPLKRALDVIGALVLGCLALPVVIILIIIVAVDSGGRPIYAQERVGEGGRVFSMYKLRTMRPDAELTSGAMFAQDRDERATELGSFLRRTHLDELPQLVNILKGDMSFIGPRPERPVFVERFRETVPGYDERHAVPQGVTGPAQLELGYHARPEEKLVLDMGYVAGFSLAQDVSILWRSLVFAITGGTARK